MIFIKLEKIVESSDSTRKYYFSTSNNESERVEACLLSLPKHGKIICVSSQIGCTRKCKFCAAGLKSFIRNLTSDEIQKQVEIVLQETPALLKTDFQVTYMGTGEPTDNWENVFISIDSLRKKYKNLKKINISTIWTENAAKKYKTIDWGKYIDFIHLQFSMHFPNDLKREEYFNTELPTITSTIESLEYISNIINDKYRINYIPFLNLNDSENDVEEISELIKYSTNAVLKVSKMCDIHDCKLSPSKNFDFFVNKIIEKGINVEVFKSDGTDINAGCGQFYNESIL